MKSTIKLVTAGVLVALIFSSCSFEPKSDKDTEAVIVESEKVEHTRDVSGEGEEDDTQFGLNDVYDVVKNGVHLVLSYDAESNSFIGTIENTSIEDIKGVRVEVSLSNRIELGPTPPKDLKPGERISVMLNASYRAFETWSTHVEIGSSEEGEHK